MSIQKEKYFSENIISCLEGIGYIFISPKEARQLRKEKVNQVILEDIFLSQIKKINPFEYKGNRLQFSEHNISAAFSALEDIALESLLGTGKKIFELLTLGKSFEETISYDENPASSEKKSFTLQFIDWENIKNNSFHVTTEFEVQEPDKIVISDIVLFVNGIPLVAIESEPDGISNAIDKHNLRQVEAKTPSKIYYYAQLLLAIDHSRVEYAAAGGRSFQWTQWGEEEFADPEFPKVPEDERDAFSKREMQLYSLCAPEKLLELIRHFILFDGSIKSVARSYQFYAVKKAMDRIVQRNPDGSRKRGVIMMSQGSGKSMTMVMLARYIVQKEDILNPRIIVVTDRIALDDQIFEIFSRHDQVVAQARTGQDLMRYLGEPGIPVLTTVMNKFETLLNQKKTYRNTDDLFILIDEVQRGNTGSLHQKMVEVFPRACYIGFTGLPLLENNDVERRFSEIIYQYSYRQAVNDRNLLPILYEERSIIEKDPMDFQSFSAEDENNSLYQWGRNIVWENSYRIKSIAEDISRNYTRHWQKQGKKGLLIAPSRRAALDFHRYFTDQPDPSLRIKTSVQISADRHDFPIDESIWGYDYKKGHSEGMPASFSEMELLIISNKLLSGIDLDVSVIYLAKPSSTKSLIQTLARATRLSEGKDYGLIIDYAGNVSKVKEIMNRLDTANDYNIAASIWPVSSVEDEIQQFRPTYLKLEQLVKSMRIIRIGEGSPGKTLISEDLKELFEETLSAFEKRLKVLLSTDETTYEFSPKELSIYKGKLTSYKQLQQSFWGHVHEQARKREPEGSVSIPEGLPGSPYYSVLKALFERTGIFMEDRALIDAVEKIEEIIRSYAIRDWTTNMRVIKKIQNSIEDVLLEFNKSDRTILDYQMIDELLANFIHIAMKDQPN